MTLMNDHFRECDPKHSRMKISFRPYHALKFAHNQAVLLKMRKFQPSGRLFFMPKCCYTSSRESYSERSSKGLACTFLRKGAIHEWTGCWGCWGWRYGDWSGSESSADRAQGSFARSDGRYFTQSERRYSKKHAFSAYAEKRASSDERGTGDGGDYLHNQLCALCRG